MLIVADVLQASDQRRNHCWQLQMRDNFFNIGVYNVLYLSNELQNLVSRNLVWYCCILLYNIFVMLFIFHYNVLRSVISKIWPLHFHLQQCFLLYSPSSAILTVNQICTWEEECKIPYLFLVTTTIFASLC